MVMLRTEWLVVLMPDFYLARVVNNGNEFGTLLESADEDAEIEKQVERFVGRLYEQALKLGNQFGEEFGVKGDNVEFRLFIHCIFLYNSN